jgi:hypothetical protein
MQNKKLVMLVMALLSIAVFAAIYWIMVQKKVTKKSAQNSSEAVVSKSSTQFPYYFIAIHNEPFYELGPSAQGTIEGAYATLQKMIAKADAYDIKLTLMFSASWADYINADAKRIAEVDEWQKNGHELSAHHHSIYHGGGWDGYSGYSKDKALEVRAEKNKSETYIGNLDNYTEEIRQIDPSINSGCVNEETDKKEMPDSIIYGTCSGFSNHLGVGIREDDGSKSEKGINQYVTVGTYNNIERKWLAHAQITSSEKQAKAQAVMDGMQNNEVYGAVVHSLDREYDAFIAFIEFLHQNDPNGKKSRTVTSVIKEKLLPEKTIESSLLEKIYRKSATAMQGGQGKCGDGVCGPEEEKDYYLCPGDCQQGESSNREKQAPITAKCGDGVCDDKEKNNPGLCPNDCR